MNPDVQAWLSQQCLKPTYEKGPVVIARLDPDAELTPGLQSRGDREIACLVLDRVSIEKNLAQGYLNELGRWKRRGKGRWIAVFVPQEIPETDLVALRGIDQVIRTPLRGGYPDHGWGQARS